MIRDFSRKLLKIIFLSLLLLAGLAIGDPASAAGRWTIPELITQEEAFARTPFIVADRSGTVHAVWSMSTADPTNEQGLDTIMYARFQDGQWSDFGSIKTIRFTF